MRGFVQAYGKEIVALIVPLIAWALNSFLKPAVKLVTATPHQFAFLINQPLIGADGKQISPSQNVYTRSLILLNEGREFATKVEIFLTGGRST